ncbi:histidinol-phosphate transaminase [Pseudaeromonas sp. ZJS20]|uniref:histidinol-phosphate transaminase n=1 Tax=Pseudaeromonas aegiceratis TaxID=3153928 RepID=UPI00390CB0DA
MSKTLTQLACQRVQDLTPYLSARRIGGKGHVFLNANEAPKAEQYELDCSRLNRYPECQPPEVISRYAAYAGLTAEQVLVSRGSDEAIELLIRTFCEPGEEEILFCPPTYGMYSISAETCGVGMRTLPPLPDFQPDVPAILAELSRGKPIKVLFFCSPNNPTGTLVEREKLIPILEATAGKSIVVVDEAYIEFCPAASMVDLISQYPHLVITRTLSKGFALAGLRCGFTLANPEVINLLLKVIAPYPIAEPVAQIAAQALSTEGLDTMRSRVAWLNRLKAELKAELAQQPCVQSLFDDHGNFLLARFDSGSALFAAMVEAGIILRDFGSKPMLENCVRITIGDEAEMAAVLDVLKRL